MQKDFINIGDFTGKQLAALLERALADKALFRAGKLKPSLTHKTLAMIFEKPSLRTRVSFETAMTQLDGHAIYLTQSDIGLGSREAVQDIARVLGRICDGIMARTFSHDLVKQLAIHSPSPVINALTDYSHPCQVMADLMTAIERFGKLEGLTLAFIGDGNNVARSLAAACTKLGANFILSCPNGYELKDFEPTGESKTPYAMVRDPRQAVANADVIYTDTWISMGQEDEKQRRLKDFAGYQVNLDLLKAAPSRAVVMQRIDASSFRRTRRHFALVDLTHEIEECPFDDVKR